MSDEHSKSTGEIWVVRFRESWALKLDHDSKPFTMAASKAEAIETGRTLARSNASELVIVGDDNEVESRESYKVDR